MWAVLGLPGHVRREETYTIAVLKGSINCSVETRGMRAREQQEGRLLEWFMGDSVQHIKSHTVCSAQC